MIEANKNEKLNSYLFIVCDPRKIRVRGRGIQPKGLRNGDDAVFFIHTKGAGFGSPEIRISETLIQE